MAHANRWGDCNEPIDEPCVLHGTYIERDLWYACGGRAWIEGDWVGGGEGPSFLCHVWRGALGV